MSAVHVRRALASCTIRHRHTMGVNSLAPHRQRHQLNSVRLSNSTPKTGENLFSCLGRTCVGYTLVSYAKTSLVRVLSLKLFTPSCSFVCHSMTVPYAVGTVAAATAAAVARTGVHTFTKYAKFVRKVRAKNASGHFVCDSGARSARVHRVM